MDGPVLSGGVIVLVAVLLWMLYLLPSWRGRHQFEAAERNAVRLNRALRVLAETSETPEEVRVELNTRAALAQQRLAKRVLSEREAAELEALRQELAAAQQDPLLRQARARRRVRIAATTVLIAGLAALGIGIWQMLALGTPALVWLGGAAVLLAALTLQRMALVAARSARRRAPIADQRAPRMSPPLHDQGAAPVPATPWTPRVLPAPLVSTVGSQAHAARIVADERQALRDAERTEDRRRRAERLAPPAPAPMVAPAATPAASQESSPYAAMGYVDDAEIEAHVRQLLSRRAAG